MRGTSDSRLLGVEVLRLHESCGLAASDTLLRKSNGYSPTYTPQKTSLQHTYLGNPRSLIYFPGQTSRARGLVNFRVP